MSSKSKAQLLTAAIIKEDLSAIKRLVRAGAPLSACYHHPDLLNHADPLSRDSTCVTAVDWAALSMKFSACAVLVDLMLAQIEWENDRLHHPPQTVLISGTISVALHKAAQWGQLNLIRGLLQARVHVGQQDPSGNSALALSVNGGHNEVMLHLLSSGAWDHERRKEEVLDLARLRGLHGSILRALEKRESSEAGVLGDKTVDSEDLDRSCATPSTRPCTVLSHAPQTCPVKSPEEAGVQKRMIGFDGEPAALGIATLSGTDMRLRGKITGLIKKGNINQLQGLLTDPAVYTWHYDLPHCGHGNCVDLACLHGHPDVALFLLRSASVQGLDVPLARHAMQAVFWCVTEDYLEVLRELLRLGAQEVLHKCHTFQGLQTPLNLAVTSCRNAAVAELLKHGAWDLETDESQRRLLSLAQAYPSVLGAFADFGLCRPPTPVRPRTPIFTKKLDQH